MKDQPTTKIDLGYLDKEFRRIDRNLTAMNFVLVGIVVALFIAFLFLITDDYLYKATMYKGYQDDIKILNQKIDKISNKQ
jgi:hypothetical protein